MGARLRSFLDKVGTVGVAVGMILIGGLVWWNVCGQGPYQDSCHYSLGCKSFYCLHHDLKGSAQVDGDGYCTKSCDTDGDCGTGYKCATLSDDSRGDLPPFGKPDQACMRVIR